MTLFGNPQLTGFEKTFDKDEVIVSKTDLDGKFTYGNRIFFKLAGLEEVDCLGIQHNLIRHPDMPRSVFKLLWETLKSGNEIFAYVVNRSANGDHYWVHAHMTPSHDGSGNIVGYHSNRRVPNKSILDQHIIPLYADLLRMEKADDSPKGGMEAAYGKVGDMLTEARMGFNQFMFSLGV